MQNEFSSNNPTVPSSESGAQAPTSPVKLLPAPNPQQLTLVATPIGNLSDFSPRAQATLTAADAILCEDTRTSATLLRTHNIKTKLIPLHDHNEDSLIPRLIADMQTGRRYALISDAGTPLVSDPGFRLVRAAIQAGLTIGGIPGPNAAILALTLSGLPPHPFLFIGFLPPKPGPRQAALTKLANAEAAGLSATLILYEAPHRLIETLTDCTSTLGPRPAAICRELTKHFEEIIRAPLPALITHFQTTAPRGEITLIIAPASTQPLTDTELNATIQSALTHLSLKDAVDAVTTATNLPRRQIYKRALTLITPQKSIDKDGPA